MKTMVAAFVLVSVCNFADAEARERPNVVIIYGDDVGFGDVGVYGAEKIPTPNIDRLAKEGLRFIDAHCGAATCTPSRYSLMTGQFAFRKKGTGVLPGNAKMAISTDQFTLPRVFQQAGYHAAVIGKWHLGLGSGNIDWNGEVKPGPLEIGFDYSFLIPATNDRVPCVYLENHRVVNLDPEDPITVRYGGKKAMSDTYPDGRTNREAMTYYPSSHGHNNSVIHGIGRIGYMSGGRAALWNDETMADVLVERTLDHMAQHKGRPFFLFFSSQDIHVPRVPHPRFHGKSQLTYRGDAMVQLDWATGAIMSGLERHGLTDNTIVIFSSDNGPVYDDGYVDGTTVRTSTQEVDRGHDGSGEYRGGKYQIYEGGTRVPLIIRWPNRIQPGVSEALVSQVDFVASFAALLDVALDRDAAPDSRNQLAALLGKDDKGSDFIVEQARGIALRQGPWKYVQPQVRQNTQKSTSGELYNLNQDVSEQNNVVKAHPEIAAEMNALLEKIQTDGRIRE